VKVGEYFNQRFVYKLLMRSSDCKNILLFLTLLNVLGCLQPYTPPNVKGNYNYLVVDGLIIGGQDSTIINLSRAQNINDSFYYTANPETGAMVSVVGANGDSYNLTEQTAGKYAVPQLNLNTNELYWLKIITVNGNEYLSDSMTPKITPPIDSVSWQPQSDGIHIYVSTHDPQNNTRYYRWQYTETWEYQSAFASTLFYQSADTMVLTRSPSSYDFTCYQTDQSTNLLLASSVNLSQDVIYLQPLTTIPLNSQKASVDYSILVDQYALSEDAYAYWQLLQQTTEQLGTLFAPQPSQINGNIHNVTNRNEPVLGFVSITTMQQQRIFIYRPSYWIYSPLTGCTERLVPNIPDSIAFYYGVGYVPVSPVYSTSTGALIGYNSAYSTCVDCTLQGGTTTKPDYWNQ
jgi:hypothetical protein